MTHENLYRSSVSIAVVSPYPIENDYLACHLPLIIPVQMQHKAMFHQLTTVVTNLYTYFSISIVFVENEQAWHTLSKYLLLLK